jgi:hypothetical protein
MTDSAKHLALLEEFPQHPLASLEPYEYFNKIGEEDAKAAFVNAALLGRELTAPNFSYPAIDTAKLTVYSAELVEILEQVLTLDMEDVENRLLRAKVEERVREAHILLTTKMQSRLSPGDTDYRAVSIRLGTMMRQVYGTPKRTAWRGVLGYYLKTLSAIEERTAVPPGVLAVWDEVRSALPSNLPVTPPYQPRPETMEWYKSQLESRLSSTRAVVDKAIADGAIILNADGKLECNAIVTATELSLACRGYGSWDVALTDESNINTLQDRSVTLIHKTRKLTPGIFYSIICGHEIDMHIAHRFNGEQSGIPILAGTGCSGSLVWEEGNGKANEALLKGSANELMVSAFRHYLSGGLALGLDRSGRGRDFVRNFELLWRMRYVANFLKGKFTDDLKADMRSTMMSTVKSQYRIYRGTDGRFPGVIFTKDPMTYYPGEADVFRKWDKDMNLDEEERILEHELERSAKINPLLPDHRLIAQRATRRR